MPVWPKSLLLLGTSVLTPVTAARLRRKRGSVKDQQAAFAALKPKLAATSFWREAGVEATMDYDAFRSRVSPRRHEQLAAAIDRACAGESDVLWPGRCLFFAATAGTTTGESRLLPVTADMLAHFRGATRDALLYYTARVGHTGVFRGRHLLLSGTTALTPLSESKTEAAFATELGGIIALSMSPTADKHLLEPGTAIAQMSEGLAKFDAMAARVSRTDISLLAGLPNWVLQFTEALRDTSSPNGAQRANLQSLWPNLECLVHTGVPIAPFQRELRAVLGVNVRFHEVYAACEGILAAQDADPAAGLRLMTDAGIFYEFIPLADFDESRLEQLGSKAVPLAEVRAGVEYVPLLTTPAGLARYCPGDVIQFVSTQPPRIAYVGRTGLRLDAFGEHVMERDLTESLVTVCQRHNWSLGNYHVAPRADASLTGHSRGAHEWWIELRPGLRETPTGPNLATELDAELQRLNADYATRRRNGILGAPVVRLVMPGVFEHWLRFRQQWGGQKKVPRCRSDRLAADDLKQVTNFARD